MYLFFLEELFGDFEDLETGEKSKEEEEDNDDDQMDYDDEESKLQDKKAKLKSTFDAEYDQSKDPDSAYLDELKKEVEIQTKVSVFFYPIIILIKFLFCFS